MSHIRHGKTIQRFTTLILPQERSLLTTEHYFVILNFTDQVTEAWRLWENHDDSKNTKHKLIETIKKNSKDFASILNLNDDHSDNTAGMTSGQQQVDDSTAEGIIHCLLFVNNIKGGFQAHS